VAWLSGAETSAAAAIQLIAKFRDLVIAVLVSIAKASEQQKQ
jgi:hypothetical protein